MWIRQTAARAANHLPCQWLDARSGLTPTQSFQRSQLPWLSRSWLAKPERQNRARRCLEALRKTPGTTVVVENTAGAGGTIGSGACGSRRA